MTSTFIGQSGLPLGLRNNNPGDFRTGIAWQGIIGQENGFLTFKDIFYGLRALALDLINNINKGTYNTIRTFITKFAPPSENDTATYIDYVSAQSGIGPDEILGTDSETIHSLMRAIMNRELREGYSALVSDAEIDQGIAMASGSTLATMPDAIVTAIENPGIYIQNASPVQWMQVIGISAGMTVLIYYMTKK